MTKYEKSMLHIAMVRNYLMQSVQNLQQRLLHHDDSKLVEPERSAYEGLDEAIEGIPFGSDEYRRTIKAHLGSALKHHYEHNSHHPEHYPNGIAGMTLFDLIEMLCDLRAACDEKGKPVIDLEVNKRIHNIGDDVYRILTNTIQEMGWDGTRPALSAIVEQLRSCHYECEAGSLENNVAFQALERLAKDDD